ncbi:CBS domain containing membrane protein [Desulfatibacillum aliphaticivorans]|uniref:CBS domain containing membrane protein n=1 Tax=Desulfatibacillum aliphaticivorans TaxID=218208 RepID=B8FAQ3_DESAL|nr:CBS domain-containing protein [Desulfatibacillum aliphaticivorans]ACL03349.1 CBS domain containing membrane protein [Desulfatibacillum aliphaticivorans]
MQKVSDIMTTEVISLKPDTDISEAAKQLLENRINGAPVVDEDGKVVGILCQSDLIVQQKRFPVPSFFTLLDSVIPLVSQKHFEKEMEKMAAFKVSQAMTEKPVVVSPDTPLEDVAALMVDKKLHTLPVVDSGKLVGVVGKEDILRTLMP